MKVRMTRRRWRGVLAAGGLALSMVPADSNAAGDPERGRTVAERWCTGCHAIAPGGGGAAALSFRTIARNRSDAYIAGFLDRPHPPSPRFTLTHQEIEDLAAYFAALRNQ